MSVKEKYYILEKDSSSYYVDLPKNCLLHIVGQEFNEQKRTLRFHLGKKKWTSFVKFPRIHFSKYHFANLDPTDLFCYSITGYIDGSPKHLNLPDINYVQGMVGLGDLAGGNFMTKINLDLDEFIENFWLSSFSGEDVDVGYLHLGNIANSDSLKLVFPHLWVNDLPEGWKIWEN